MCFTPFGSSCSWREMPVTVQPSVRDQMFGKMAANNAGNPGDQRVAIHQLSPFVFSVTLIGGVGMSAMNGVSGVSDMSAFMS